MSIGEQLRHWLAARGHNLAWVRKIALWQARVLPAPYALRFRFARWANLLALDSAALPETEIAYDGIRLVLDLRDHVQWVTYYFGSHEPHILALFRKLLRADASVVDLGAHVGIYTLYAGQFYRNQSTLRVLAVEPTPQVFCRLQQHVALNDLSHVVQPVSVAVGDREGEAVLYLSSYPNSANSALRDLRGNHPHTQDGQTINVRLVRLDVLVDEVGLARPVGLIKADIEGAELEAFRGASAVLAYDRPHVLFEAHPIWMQRFGYALQDMLAFWSARRYTCFRVNPNSTLCPLTERSAHTEGLECLAVPAEQVNTLRKLGIAIINAK